MKSPKKGYLSHRVQYLFAVMTVFLTVQLVIFVFLGIKDRWYFWLAAFDAVFLLVGIGLYLKWIYIPYKQGAKVLLLFASGYLFQDVFDQRVALSPEFEKALEKFKEMIDKKEMISASKRQAQYLALQNQINPHFLYNTLEGIRGETLSAGLDNVANMTESLATFFRYTISQGDHLVTLADELSNIENYYVIQRYRFGERLNLAVDFNAAEEMELMKYHLPKLTLQPIVENAICHGIEKKIEKGTVRIKIETTPKRLIIIVSDDGVGIEGDRLEELSRKLNHTAINYVKPDSEEKGGIAIVNVNSRIKLLFGEEYGICIYSTPNVGTDVVITLPLITDAKRELI